MATIVIILIAFFIFVFLGYQIGKLYSTRKIKMLEEEVAWLNSKLDTLASKDYEDDIYISTSSINVANAYPECDPLENLKMEKE